MVAIGAATTGLLRAPVTTSFDLRRLLLVGHEWLGAVLVVVTIVAIARRGRFPALTTGLIVLAAGSGWWSTRMLSPIAGALHAAAAATATVSVAATLALRTPVSSSARDAAWVRRVAQIGLALMVLQVTVGAMLRHQLVTVEWHMLTGGLAVLMVLIAAGAVIYSADVPESHRRAARWTIAVTLGQVALGVTVFVLIVMGAPSTSAWLASTIAHVTGGTATMLVLLVFLAVLRSG